MYIKRKLTESTLEAASEYPVIAIMGPRQSGKTTFAQKLFPNHNYISLEDFDLKNEAQADPRRFLAEQPSGAGLILDEIQHAPELLSYMQTIVDREKKNGFFIVTGSQNFLINQAITQTLAGRMAILNLMPLSIAELADAGMLPENIETLIYKGGYPKAHASHATIQRLYKNYITQYVERDVRQIKNVSDLGTFQLFMRMCAGRIGQVLNLSSLGNDCGITHATAKAWLSLLQATYVVFLLEPYYQNYGKRLIKSPKLYFMDTGLACSLLRIRNEQELQESYMRGPLVETLIISDLIKQQYNLEQQPTLFFWRDKAGHEIDCIIDQPNQPIPVEIKAGKTVTSSFFQEMAFWQEQTKNQEAPRYLVYAGDKNHNWPLAQALSWKNSGNIIEMIEKKRERGGEV